VLSAPRVTGRIAAWNADAVDADMGPKFGDAIKFCFRKRFDDSSPSLGSSADAVPALCDKLRDLMPKDGEPRGDVAEILLARRYSLHRTRGRSSRRAHASTGRACAFRQRC